MDFAVLQAFCASKGGSIEKADYDGCVQDILMQDLKAGQTTSQLKSLCGCNGQTNDDFKKSLAPFVRSCAVVYEELENCIFQGEK